MVYKQIFKNATSRVFPTTSGVQTFIAVKRALLTHPQLVLVVYTDPDSEVTNPHLVLVVYTDPDSERTNPPPPPARPRGLHRPPVNIRLIILTLIRKQN